jgi:AhpC/TSA family
VMFAPRFFALAEKYPKESVAPDALLWIYQNVSQGNLPVGALDRLFTDYIEHKQIGQVCETLPGRIWVPADTEKHVRKVIDKNPHREVKGLACLCLAQMLQNRAENSSGDQAEMLIKEAKEWYERVVREHGDVKVSRASLGEKATGALFALHPVGKRAPEIEGQDLDGKKLKLSNFKGKVVVLVSWATWCAPCMAMVPHERELVKRLDGKPFALLGVNCDGDREKARRWQS